VLLKKERLGTSRDLWNRPLKLLARRA
jgi:hypothetical protein